LPIDSAGEASIVDEVEVYGMESLKEVVNFLSGSVEKERTKTDKDEYFLK